MTEHWEKIRKHLEEIDLEDHEQKQMLTMCFFVGGEYDGKYMTEWQVEQNLCNGKHGSDDKEIRENGGCTHYAVLDNVPEVEGYTFMWDGGMIRYETWEVYDAMFN